MNSADRNANYHQQDQDDFCGEAVLQMMLARLGTLWSDQNDLAKVLAESKDFAWLTSPRALVTALNELKPRDFDGYFEVRFNTSWDAAWREMVTSVFQTGLPAPAVVYGGVHWVLVNRVVLETTDPVSENAYMVKGVHASNPFPTTAFVKSGTRRCPPPPHYPNDPCGIGGPFGSANTFITLRGWRKHYWPVGNPFPFISIIPYGARRTKHTPIQLRFENLNPVPAGASQSISARSAVNFAKDGIAEFRLRKGPLKRALGDVQVDSDPGNVTAVGSRPNGPASYFVISLLNSDAECVGLAMVDGFTGHLLGIQAPPCPKQKPPQDDDVLSAILSQAGRLQAALGATISKDTLKIRDTLFWRPDPARSLTPFMPYVVVDVTGSSPLFVAQDTGGDLSVKLGP